MRRAACYLRVSTDKQSSANQRPEVVQIVRARGLEIVEVFEETASAAKKRPEFDRMLLAAHRGEFDAIVVWSLDRLGRSMIGNMQTVLDLDRLGVEIISVREQWLQMQGPVRSLLLAVFGWVAEQERERIRDRTREGLARARREGKQVGRPRAHVDIDQALLLRRRGLSIRRAASRLGIGATTLHRILQAHDEVVRASGRPVPKTSSLAAQATIVIPEGCDAVAAE